MVGAVGVGDQVGRLDLDVGRVAVGDRLGGDEGDVVDVGDQVEVAAHEGDVEAPVGGADVAGQLGQGQGPPHVQDDVGVDLGGQVVLHDETVADGAHREIEPQMLEQRLAVVKRQHRRFVDPRAQRQVLHLEGLQVAPRDEPHLAPQAETLLEVPLEIEVEGEVVDLEDAGAAVGEPLAVERQIEVARLEGEEVRELDAAGPHARGADDQQPLVVEEDLDVVKDDAVVADLDDAALHLHLAAEIAQAKVDGVEVEAAADVGVEQGPPQMGPDVRLPLRVGDGVGGGVGEQARADVAVDVGLQILGDEPGAERGAAAQLHRRTVDGDGQVVDRHAAPVGEREPPGVDHDVAVELVRADADRVDDGHLAAEIGPIERPAGRELGAQIAAQPIDGGGAQEWLEQLEIEVAGERAGDGAPVEPPFDPQVAAVGGEVRLVERDVIAGEVDVDRARRLDPDPLHRRLAVRAVDRAGDREPQLGQEDVERQRLPGLKIDGHPPAGDAPPVAEGDQLGRQRVELQAAEGDAAMNARPLGQERGVDVEVEAIEQLTVNGDAGRALRADRRRRQRQVPLAEADATHHHLGEIDVARQLGALGPPGYMQLRAHEAAHGDAGRRDAGDGGERKLGERDVEIEVLVREPDAPVDVGLPAAVVGDPQGLDGEALTVERQLHGADGERVAERRERRARWDGHVGRDAVEGTVRVAGERDSTRRCRPRGPAPLDRCRAPPASNRRRAT